MKILIGVSASIAAYKMPEIIRALAKDGFDIKLVITKSAENLFSPILAKAIINYTSNINITQSNHSAKSNNYALDCNSVFTDASYIDADGTQKEMIYLDLAKWADLVLVMPASANFIAKFASGICDDLLSLICVAIDISRTKILIAPAMNPYMWSNPSLQENVTRIKLRSSNNHNYIQILSPQAGSMLCGDIGYGRMIDYLELKSSLDLIASKYNLTLGADNASFAIKYLVINAGATREQLDPVRFISNNSSGKMGICLALSAAKKGIYVKLILANVDEYLLHKYNYYHNSLYTHYITIIYVINTLEMLDAVDSAINEYLTLESKDTKNAKVAFIACAAVCDYVPVYASQHKIKKSTPNEGQDGQVSNQTLGSLSSHQSFEDKIAKQEAIINFSFKQNIDILKHISEKYAKNIYTIGFAAETQNLIQYAKAKLIDKKLDLIIANDVSSREIGFGSDYNQVHIIDKQYNVTTIAIKDKQIVADEIMHHILSHCT